MMVEIGLMMMMMMFILMIDDNDGANEVISSHSGKMNYGNGCLLWFKTKQKLKGEKLYSVLSFWIKMNNNNSDYFRMVPNAWEIGQR